MSLLSEKDCQSLKLSRRDFFRAGVVGAGAAGLTLTGTPPALGKPVEGHAKNLILLFLVGGPSHLDTWDPKPAAPDFIRGPFRPIPSSVSGIQLCETFPRMAQLAHRFALIRSVHHHEAPIHETGQQLLQTGRLVTEGMEYPHIGAVIAKMFGQGRNAMPPFVILPGPMGNTGIHLSHGQDAGFLGPQYKPVFHRPSFASEAFGDNSDSHSSPSLPSNQRFALDTHQESFASRSRYGQAEFGQSCLLARRLVEHGVRVVTVNMYQTVFNKLTWDCHADGGALGTTLQDYKDTVCPTFDQVFSALIEDLHERGLLDETLVVAMGEFGRTPRINANGGRDHWPGVWSIVMAGGGVKGGQVIGTSDRIGSEPSQRPVTPAEVTATIYHALGIDARTQLRAADNRLIPLTDAQPILELF